MDTQYRTIWDKYTKENYEVGHIDANNNIGYYASKYFILPDFRQWNELGYHLYKVEFISQTI